MKPDRRLLAAAREVRLGLAVVVGSGLLTGLVTVAQAFCLSRIVAGAFLDGRSLADLSPLLAVTLGLIGLRALLAWVREVSAYEVAGGVKRRLREQAFSALIARGPIGVQSERTGELVSTLTEGIESLDAYFGQYLPNLALAALVPLTILLVVFPLDVLTGVVFLVTAPLIPVFMILIGRLADALTKRQWESLSRMSAHFLDVLQGLTTLKLLGRSRAQGQTIAETSRRFGEATLGVLRVAFLSAFVLELQATISTAIVAVEIGLRLLNSLVSFEQAFFILILAPEFYAPLRALGASFHAGIAGATAARRIFAVRDGPQPELPPVAPAAGPDAAFADWSKISFADVHFAYPGGGSGSDPGGRDNGHPDVGAARPALHGVSFDVGRGQTVALVGPSGSGKSTVAHLLLRFVEPDRGHIALDGRPLSELPAEAWRSQVAWVPQLPYLFNATVADNIRLGRPEATLADVVDAARLANADDFIRALPASYDTVVGERGARLSGGQAQRLALARAFLKDAPLLVLDEAVANLDAEQEALIQEAIGRLASGRTVLAIAHRLGSVRHADSIVVLDEGQVVQVGRHEGLSRQVGLYGDLVAANGPATSEPVRNRTPHAAIAASEPVGRALSDEYAIDYPVGRSAAAGRAGAADRSAATGASRATRGERGGTLWRLLSLVWPLRGWVALSTLLGFLTVGSGIGLLATSAFIIASAALHPPVAELMVAIVGVRFFGIARGGFRYLERYVSHTVTFRLLTRLRVWFYEAIEPLAPARLLAYRGGDLLTRIVADVETLQHLYVRVLAPSLVAGLVLVLVGIFFGSYDPALAGVLLAFLLLTGLGVPLLTRRLSLALGGSATRARSELSERIVDGVQGLADLTAFGQERRYLDRVLGLSRHWIGIQARLARVNGLHAGLSTLFTGLGTWAVLVVGIALVTSGKLSGVSLAVLGLAATASFEAVLPLPLAFQHLGSCREAARRLFEIVDAEPAAREPGEAGRTADWARPAPPTTSPGENGPDSATGRVGEIGPREGRGLAVAGLRFRYGPDEPWALDEVGFRLTPGARLAIVGPSGCGKSTLVHLLLRFWEQQEGTISLSGRDLREYRREELARQIAVVSQRTHLFNATIRANLLIARPGAVSEEEMTRAARQAQIHDFISGLPRGYDTWVGEQGLLLSGGQRQRLAIARALLQDAPLLVLDEATANLDNLTEREVTLAIQSAMARRTTLIVTHRLTGLEAVDEILVLRAGRIVERGRHAELMRLDGLYARMWLLQNDVERQPAGSYGSA